MPYRMIVLRAKSAGGRCPVHAASWIVSSAGHAAATLASGAGMRAACLEPYPVLTGSYQATGGSMSRINDVGGMQGFPPGEQEAGGPAFHADWEAARRARTGLRGPLRRPGPVRRRRPYRDSGSLGELPPPGRHGVDAMSADHVGPAAMLAARVRHLETLLEQRGLVDARELDRAL